MTLSDSVNVTLASFNIQNSEKLTLDIFSSSISEISHFEIRNSSKAIQISSSTISSFKNSVFTDNGNTSLLFGGVMDIINSDVNLSNNSFTNNTAKSGGAIYFTCSSMTL